MNQIKASEAHLHIGRKVRIVYVIDKGIIETTKGLAAVWDDMITPPVVLKSIDVANHLVEIERDGKPAEKVKFKEILASE